MATKHKNKQTQPNATEKAQLTGCVSLDQQPTLSQAERTLLLVLQEEGGNVRTASIRYGCTPQRVRKVRQKAENMGVYRRVVASVAHGGVTAQPAQPKLQEQTPSIEKQLLTRLHAEKFAVDLIHPIPSSWKDHINRTFPLDNCKVVCHEQSITVLSTNSFYAKNELLALSKSEAFWDSFFIKLENQLSILLVKERRENIKRVYAEWETVDTVIGETVSTKCDEQIRIYDKVDGHLRLTTDMSLRHKNHETHHHQKGMRDSQNVRRFVEDFLEQPQAPTLSELARIVGNLAQQNSETAAGLTAIVQLMQKPKVSDPVQQLQRKPDYVG